MKALEKFGNCYFQHFRWDVFQAQCGQKRGCDCVLRTNQDTVVLGLDTVVFVDYTTSMITDYDPLRGSTVQGHLAHKKTPPPQRPRHLERVAPAKGAERGISRRGFMTSGVPRS